MAFTTSISTLTIPEIVDSVERYYTTVKETIKPVARQLYQLDPIGFGKGDTKTYNEYDGSTYANRKPQGVNVSRAKFGLGYEKVGKGVRFGTEIAITEEMRMLGKDIDVKRAMTDLTNFIPQREELDLTHRLTFGTSTSYVDMDGQTVDVSMGDGFSLFYAAHTLAGSALTYSTRVSGDPLFSQGGLESALGLTVTDVYSNLGEKRVLNFNTVWSGNDPATVAEIKRVIKSQTDSTQTNSGVINPYVGVFANHVILPQLATTATGAVDSTKSKWWGICAVGQWNGYLGMIEEENLRLPSKDNNLVDGHADVLYFGVRQMRMIVVTGARGMVGSCPQS